MLSLPGTGVISHVWGVGVEGVLQFEARGSRLVCQSCCNASACYVTGGEHGKLWDDWEHSDVTAQKKETAKWNASLHVKALMWPGCIFFMEFSSFLQM